MKASIRIGVTALMVLSIFSGVALADPPNGGEAGDTFQTATPLTVPHSYEWTIYPNGYIEPGDKDFYKPNTVRNDHLWYQIDQVDHSNGAWLAAYNGLSYSGSNVGDFTVTSSDGSSYVDVYANPSYLTPSYQFALRIY